MQGMKSRRSSRYILLLLTNIKLGTISAGFYCMTYVKKIYHFHHYFVYRLVSYPLLCAEFPTLYWRIDMVQQFTIIDIYKQHYQEGFILSIAVGEYHGTISHLLLDCSFK